jgi:hypothetical protein
MLILPIYWKSSSKQGFIRKDSEVLFILKLQVFPILFE